MGVRWMQRRGKIFACGLHFSLVYSLFLTMPLGRHKEVLGLVLRDCLIYNDLF